MWIYGSDMDGESMKNVILQLVMAFVGSLGFAMLFRLRRALWISASLGGVFCWGGYLLVMYFSDGQIFTSDWQQQHWRQFMRNSLRPEKELRSRCF